MIKAKLEDLRRELLDLTRRNRLLNQGGQGPRILHVLDVDPDHVRSLLVDKKRRLTFLAREEAPAGRDPGEDDDVELPFSEEGDAGRLAPMDDQDTVEKPAVLQTRLDGPRLQSRLLRMEREARHAFEDHGTNLLHLSFGTILWKEAGSKEVISRAPLLFLPVELSRPNVKSRHRIHIFDEDLDTNPNLRELCTRQFGFEMPAFDPERHESLQDYFDVVRDVIADIEGWELELDCHLGLYSFSKLLMYRDLDPALHGQRLFEHPLIRLLSGCDVEEGLLPDSEIPDPSTLDRLDPKDVWQVMDADSSQQAAILAAKQGLSFVLEGPPGTGKSQTITNIIAECLAEGKSVLFVSEKAAALEVVARRLDSVDLGCFTLELHSRKASKRAVLSSIGSALERRQDWTNAAPLEPDSLAQMRDSLNAYTRELQTPIGVLGSSPYRSMSQAIRLVHAPEAPFRIPGLLEIDQERLREIQAKIRRLDHRIRRIGSPEKHAWRGSRLQEARLDLRQTLKLDLPALDGALAQAHAHCQDLATLLGWTALEDFESCDALLDCSQFLHDLPVLEEPWIRSPEWESRWEQFLAWIQDGRDRQALIDKWAEALGPTAEGEDWTALHDRWRAHKDSFLRLFRPSWYRDKRKLRQYALGNLEKAYEALPLLIRSRELRARLEQDESTFGQRLGSLWSGLDADFGWLEDLVQSIHRVREKIRQGRLSMEPVVQILTTRDRQALGEAQEKLCDSLTTLQEAWRDVAAKLRTRTEDWFGMPWSRLGFASFASRMEGLTSNLEGLQDWANFQSSCAECMDEDTKGFLDWALSEKGIAGRGQLESCFLRQFYRLFVDESLETLPRLRDFRGLEQEELIERFRDLDHLWIQHNRDRLCRHIQKRWPHMGHNAHRNSKLGILQAELGKKRGHMSLRRLFSQLGELIQRIQPCFMMSPISVAQFLEPGKVRFDLVIFDEASQVEPADAYGAISRGDQLILVGDENQLPPTNFFARVEREDGALSEEGFREADLESVLFLGKARLPHRSRLRWHYRSRHESLIDFSNSRFYDHDLRVFPSPERSREELGLKFCYTRDAVYLRGKGQYNPTEAREIAGRVIEHAVADPHLSLGVGAFSMPQQRAIEDEIERFRRESDDPRVEAFFLEHEHEPFFVKNLETIQGDERDVILLSVGYARDEFGKLSMNFGPLNREGGWRRLNVLITRARRKCEIYSSIRAEDIDLTKTDARGVRALKDYLYYAEHGHLQGIDAPRNDHDSPFEAEVCKLLREKGYDVHAQVGSAGFSIDLAIVHPDAPGSYLCGVECDGATYHSSPTARDRDRLREEVLEGLGWSILRVWSTDWFHRPESTATRLLSEIEDLLRDSPVMAGSDSNGGPLEEKANDASARVVALEPQEQNGFTSPLESQELQPYEPAVLGKRGTMEDMAAATPNDLAELIIEVVDTEGPVHLDRALRVVASSFEARATKRPREIFQRGMLIAQSQGRIVTRGEFLWPRGMARPRIRFRGEDCPVTETEYIANEELQAAILQVLRLEMGLPPDDVVESTRRWLGFKRSGRRLTASLEAARDALIASGTIQVDEDGYLEVEIPS